MSACLDESGENDVTHPETLCDGSEGLVPIVPLLLILLPILLDRRSADDCST
jgi:hypothetical protein